MTSRKNLAPALWLLVILALVAAVRIRMLSLPLERDEGEFAYAGQLILEGVPPYKLMYNMKMPGIYAAYALVMAVFGETTEGIHFGFMLVNFGAIVLVYFVSRHFLDRVGSVAASAAYALLSLSTAVLGFAAHATHFVVLAALGAILVLLRTQEKPRLPGYFWSGLLFGVAFLMKQPGGAFAFFGASLIAWTALRREAKEWKMDGWRMILFATGVAAPILLTGFILWRAGVWDKFWWWTVTYAKAHATLATWKQGRERLVEAMSSMGWNNLFWGLALVGLVCVLAAREKAHEKFFLSSWLIFSAAAVCPTFFFSSHYFVLMLPVVAILAARAFCTVAAWTSAASMPWLWWAPWALFSVALITVAHFDRLPYIFWHANEVMAQMFPKNEFDIYPVIADYLKNHTDRSATFAIMGSEPELLFDAHRHSVTGYIYMYDLVQNQPHRERMGKEMISEVEQGRPDFMVFVNLSGSWLPNPPQLLEPISHWVMDYTDRFYVPFGVVTFPPNQFIWGPDCLAHVPPKDRCVMIFQRRPDAPAKSAP